MAQLTPRGVSAGLGLVAAGVTVAYLGVRLLKATAPVPTPTLLSSASVVPIALEALRINDLDILPKDWDPSRSIASQVDAARPLGTVALEVGRALSIKASLAVPPGSTISCDVEPRPYGSCVLKVAFSASSEMRCEFECGTEASRP